MGFGFGLGFWIGSGRRCLAFLCVCYFFGFGVPHGLHGCELASALEFGVLLDRSLIHLIWVANLTECTTEITESAGQDTLQHDTMRVDDAQINVIINVIVIVVPLMNTAYCTRTLAAQPRRCPVPLVFHESGSTDPVDAPVSLPDAAVGWRMAVP